MDGRKEERGACVPGHADPDLLGEHGGFVIELSAGYRVTVDRKGALGVADDLSLAVRPDRGWTEEEASYVLSLCALGTAPEAVAEVLRTRGLPGALLGDRTLDAVVSACVMASRAQRSAREARPRGWDVSELALVRRALEESPVSEGMEGTRLREVERALRDRLPGRTAAEVRAVVEAMSYCGLFGGPRRET